MKLEDWLRRTDEVLALGHAALNIVRRTDFGDYLAEDKFAEFRTAALSFLSNVYGSKHPYYAEFSEKAVHNQPEYARLGLGILSAARAELAGGWFRTTRGLVSAEIFGDFLEMAEHLLAEHYKDAAAVIAGSSLEEHLRQLASSLNVAVTFTKGNDVIPTKADTLNADLAGAGAYSKLDQKSITAWLDLRNKAAHGKYGEYDEAQVRLMTEGIRQFMTRISV